MVTVSKGVLKAKMLEYFREVERTGESLVVTDRGREVLEIRPLKKKAITTEEVLAWYRSGEGKGILPPEKVLMEPEPLKDWEALSDKNFDNL
jgi:antitoxin (DNA-binding transcriptional repressor) of toxin-antitoxin stability system